VNQIIDFCKKKRSLTLSQFSPVTKLEDLNCETDISLFLSEISSVVRSYSILLDKSNLAGALCIIAKELAESNFEELTHGIDRADSERMLKRILAGLILDSDYAKNSSVNKTSEDL